MPKAPVVKPVPGPPKAKATVDPNVLVAKMAAAAKEKPALPNPLPPGPVPVGLVKALPPVSPASSSASWQQPAPPAKPPPVAVAKPPPVAVAKPPPVASPPASSAASSSGVFVHGQAAGTDDERRADYPHPDVLPVEAKVVEFAEEDLQKVKTMAVAIGNLVMSRARPGGDEVSDGEQEADWGGDEDEGEEDGEEEDTASAAAAASFTCDKCKCTVGLRSEFLLNIPPNHKGHVLEAHWGGKLRGWCQPCSGLEPAKFKSSARSSWKKFTDAGSRRVKRSRQVTFETLREHIREEMPGVNHKEARLLVFDNIKGLCVAVAACFLKNERLKALSGQAYNNFVTAVAKAAVDPSFGDIDLMQFQEGCDASYLTMLCDLVLVSYMCRQRSCLYYGLNSQWLCRRRFAFPCVQHDFVVAVAAYPCYITLQHNLVASLVSPALVSIPLLHNLAA